jgi:hypothetical protein
MDLELSGKVAVVTGASKGIGLAVGVPVARRRRPGPARDPVPSRPMLRRGSVVVSCCLFLLACSSWKDAMPAPWTGHVSNTCKRNPLQTSKAVHVGVPVWTNTTIGGKSQADALAAMPAAKRASFEADLRAFDERVNGMLAQLKTNPMGLKYAPLPVALATASGNDVAEVTVNIISFSGGAGWSFGLIDATTENAYVTYEVHVADAAGACESFNGRQELGGGYGSGDRTRALGIMVASDLAGFLRDRYWAGRTPQPTQ